MMKLDWRKLMIVSAASKIELCFCVYRPKNKGPKNVTHTLSSGLGLRRGVRIKAYFCILSMQFSCKNKFPFLLCTEKFIGERKN